MTVLVAVGERFGRLTSVGESFYVKEKSGRSYWYVTAMCDCGTERTFRASHLKSAKIMSCGCLRKELSAKRVTTHGLANTLTYRAWRSMKNRCNNPKHEHFKSYGGRGIGYDPLWENFENFFADMGLCPAGLTLDRRDVNGHYFPGNCTWSSWADQARNRRTNRLITLNGTTKCVVEWAEELGLGRSVIYARLALGWSSEKALTAPIRVIKKAQKTEVTTA